MKKIEAFIRPEKYKDVQKAVKKAGYIGLSVTPVKGRGAAADGSAGSGRSLRRNLSVLDDKWKIEIVCSDKAVHSLLRTVAGAAWTGKAGDGKIFVSPVDQAFRIRTGESGEEVL